MSKRPHTKKATRYVCETCAIVFRPHRYTSKYCSNSCSPPWNKGLTMETDSRVIAPWQGKKRPDIAGENCHLWKEDRNLLTKNEHKHLDTVYRIWMRDVKNRDRWKCKISNKDCKGRLEAHHILSWKDYPELRYEVNNGITLCLAHHPRSRAEEKRLQGSFQELVASASKAIIC